MAINERFFQQRFFYFDGWPVYKGYKLQETNYDVLNFLHRWTFKDSIKKNVAAFSEWTIRDSDTIYSISEQLYNNTHFYWIIMMMNDMIDPTFAWPMDESELLLFVESKYGVENTWSMHHWESRTSEDVNSLPTGIVVSGDYPYIKASISNYDHEAKLNEKRRQIKLLEPKHLTAVLKEKRSITDSKFSKVYRGA